MGGPYSWVYSNDKSKDQLWRDFYLNTPPNLNLTETSDYSGCALFFYNATAALQTDTGFDDYASFSCDTVMASQCQQDLNQQALDDLALVLSPNNGLNLDTAEKADICGTLANRFADREIPQSCSFYVQQPTWGYTTGQDVVGTSGLHSYGVEVSESRNCSVTNNDTYFTMPVESAYVDLRSGSETIEAFQNGTTPIITAFYATPDQSEAPPFLSEPEIHLSCLRAIVTDEEQKQINGGVRPTASSVSTIWALALVAAIALTIV